MRFGHFEVVQSNAGWAARYIADAGPRPYEWSTSPYPSRRRALVAIFALTGHTVQKANGYPAGWSHLVQMPTHLAEVRSVDERPHHVGSACRCGCQRPPACALCGGVEGDCPCETGVEG